MALLGTESGNSVAWRPAYVFEKQLNGESNDATHEVFSVHWGHLDLLPRRI